MANGNFLIVGSGLAGITVATHLIESGKKVTILNNGMNHSTNVAAGQINPLVFRRMTKSWRVDDFLPYAENYYKGLETKTSSQIYVPIQIRRIFSSEHEKALWIKKQMREDFQKYMEIITEEDEQYDVTINEFGTGRIKNSSYVIAKNFTEKSIDWIKENGLVVNESFDYELLNPETGSYKNQEYDKIIFCEGYMNNQNPWFKAFPVETTKGEVLTLISEELPSNESLNRKCFLLPIGNHKFRLGATYVWKTENIELTTEGKEDLLDKLNYLSRKPYTLLNHQAGIRPTSPDRRPIIGHHPEFNKLAIFNGLGTKGYLMAPLLAKEFVELLLFGNDLDKEVRLERFLKK